MGWAGTGWGWVARGGAQVRWVGTGLGWVGVCVWGPFGFGSVGVGTG